MSKAYKQIRYCKKCGNRFEVKHLLRYYCDECKFKLNEEKTSSNKASKKSKVINKVKVSEKKT